MKTYTLQEACIALAIDTATLWRWMKRARMEAATDNADERRRTLTHAQVQQLARAHHRQLTRSVKPESLDQETMQQRIDELERRIEALEHKIQELAAWQQSPMAVRPAPATDTITASKPLVNVRLQAHHDGEGLPDGLISYPSFAVKHGWHDEQGKPKGLTTIQKAVDTGRLPTHKGNWKSGKATVKHALDAAGQEEFYRLYHDHPNFTPCPQCPHINLV